MDSFGAYLKTHREKKGIRLEEIASITKIHLHSLELLEAGKWDALPPEPFIRGFIIAYAKYVGLPTQEVIDRYKEATRPPGEPVAETPIATPKPVSSGPVVASPNEFLTQMRLPSAPKLITAASLLAVIGLATILINVGRDADNPTPTQVVVQPETAPPGAKADERNVAVAADPAAKALVDAGVQGGGGAPAGPAPTAPKAAHEVSVQGKERTWMKVVIDDSAPQEIFLPEGKSMTYTANQKIKVVLGNATGSKVVYNGREVEGKQFMGTIRSYKFPPEARFPQDVPAKPAAKPEGEAAAASGETP